MMQHDEKLVLLKSIRGLGQIPERQLATLAGYLRPKQLGGREFVFKEGAIGASLYFVSSGHIRISKLADQHTAKDLVLLGPGDFFGEMALVEEESFRSASAIATEPCILFELYRGDLNQWIKLYPQQAVKFFAELLNIQSKRLLRTSGESTLYANLFNFDPGITVPDYLVKVLDQFLYDLEGTWSGAAYLFREANGQPDLIAWRESRHSEEILKKIIDAKEPLKTWMDPSTFHISTQSSQKTSALFIFHTPARLNEKDRSDIEQTVASVSLLISKAVELIRLRSQETSKNH